MIESQAPKHLELVNQMLVLVENADESRMIEFVTKHPEIRASGSLEGIVQFGIELSEKETRQLEKLQDNLADDFVVLAEGERPNLGLPMTALICGLGLGVYLLIRTRREKKT